MVGPGGFLRPDDDLRAPGKIRREKLQLSGCRPVESRRLGGRFWQIAGRNPVSQRYRRLFLPENRSAVVCLLAARQGDAASEGSHNVSDRQRQLDFLRRLATKGSADQAFVFSVRRKTFVRSAAARWQGCCR